MATTSAVRVGSDRLDLRAGCADLLADARESIDPGMRGRLGEAMREFPFGRRFDNPFDQASLRDLRGGLRKVAERSLPLVVECVAHLYPELWQRVIGFLDGEFDLPVDPAQPMVGPPETERDRLVAVLARVAIDAGHAVAGEIVPLGACLLHTLTVGTMAASRSADAASKVSRPVVWVTNGMPDRGSRDTLGARATLLAFARRAPPEAYAPIKLPTAFAEATGSGRAATAPKAKEARADVAVASAPGPVTPVALPMALSKAPAKAPAQAPPSKAAAKAPAKAVERRVTRLAAKVIAGQSTRASTTVAAKAAPTPSRADGNGTAGNPATPGVETAAPVHPAMNGTIDPVRTRVEVPGFRGVEFQPPVVAARRGQVTASPTAIVIDRGVGFAGAAGSSPAAGREGPAAATVKVAPGGRATDDLAERVATMAMAFSNAAVDGIDWEALASPVADLERVRRARVEEAAAVARRRRLEAVDQAIARIVSLLGERLEAWGVVHPVAATRWTAEACDPDEAADALRRLEVLHDKAGTVIDLEAVVPSGLAARRTHRDRATQAEADLVEEFAGLAARFDPARVPAPAPGQGGEQGLIDWRNAFDHPVATVIERRLGLARLATLFHHGQFRAAVDAVREMAAPPAGLEHIGKALEARLNFDASGALNELDRPMPPARLPSPWLEAIRAALRTEMKALEARPNTNHRQRTLVAELFWQADLVQRQGRLIDFVARIAALVEQAILVEIGREDGKTYATAEDFPNDGARGNPTAPGGTVARSRTDVDGSVSNLFRELERRTGAIGTASDTLRRLHAYTSCLDRVKRLRNRSCVAHALEAVNEKAIDEALNEAVVGNPIRDDSRAGRFPVEIPPNLFGSTRVLWVARQIVECSGLSLAGPNPVAAWGEKIAVHLEEGQ